MNWIMPHHKTPEFPDTGGGERQVVAWATAKAFLELKPESLFSVSTAYLAKEKRHHGRRIR